MKVLIIPEDFVNDEHILQPVIEAMMKAKNKKNAKVRVCKDPRLQGVSQALKWENIEKIIDRYRMIDLFLLCIDRDGVETRKERLNNIEQKASEMLPEGKLFLAENAWQEVEVWILAGHKKLPTEWKWEEIREEINPKEVYFEPFAKQRNLLSEPGKGRKTLGREAARNYRRIRRLCPEVADIEERII
ncbi:hypothetical protein QUF72_00980 [Desulfobacterales bacterium HSG2]|nr:hypothetical protein [Desulfobacterales bacterium HSG2]